MIKTLIIIGLGGFLGSVCRFLVQQLLSQQILSSYPWGTFVANMLGCFLIGVIFGYTMVNSSLPQEAIWFFATGFCGAFTTFSTFSYEGILLINNERVLIAFLYLGISVFLGLILTWVGMNFGKVLG